MKKRKINALQRSLKTIEIKHEEDVRILFDFREQPLQQPTNINLTIQLEGKNKVYIVVIANKRTNLSLNITYKTSKKSNSIINNTAFVMDSAQIKLHDKVIVEQPIDEVHLRQQIYLYSTQARGEAIPEMVLKTNKVKIATHESSISDINEREQAYFASKGIDYKKLQQLLLEDYISYCL
ncbi:MAG: hypothetical protein GXN99_01270 [Candidatus Nanohaloarchaeota archaeon]|nr:hypothetical protein [Candidatus Nanohaloarchaeota archaeon]